MPDSIPAAAQLSDVSKTFCTNGSLTHALSGVSLEARLGELVLLLGPSGSGKTTLLTLLAGLAQPTSGSVCLVGRDIRAYSGSELQALRAGTIGFVFQNFLLLESLTVEENVSLVQGFTGSRTHGSGPRVLRILAEFGVDHLALRRPNTLSQGEKQRVAIARAVANDAQIILADEPTASLEARQGIEVIRILHRLARHQNRCVIVASHDLRLKRYADRIVRLENGRIHADRVVQ